MIKEPIKAEIKTDLFYRYGVSANSFQYSVLYDYTKSDDIFPYLIVPDRTNDRMYLYEFNHRNKKLVSFKYVESDLPAVTLMASYDKKIMLDEWLEGLSLYFDYLAVKEIEKQEKLIFHEPKYHIIIDERDNSGKILSRRLLYSTYSQKAAKYILRQDRLWQDYLFKYYNILSLSRNSVFTKFYRLSPELDCSTTSKLTVTVEYPYGKNKPSYSRHWHWHISHTIPLVEIEHQDVKIEQDRTDERWQHRPGDPKLLRERGTGLYGSYPSFEGDEEAEYRDE